MYTFSVPKCKSQDILLQYQITGILIDFIIKVIRHGKAVLSIITTLLFVLIGNAQEERNVNQKYDFKCGSLITKYKKEVTEYKYGSLDDLKNGIDEIIHEFDFSPENKKEQCEVTIELKVELLDGIATVLVSESITTDCSDNSATQAVKRFKTILITE